MRRLERVAELSIVLPGSMLAVDDGHTARVPISSQVQITTARAWDALEAFRDLTVTEINPSAALRPFAHYSLIRMACEGAGLGLWLLRPGQKAKRVRRSLNLELTHHYETWDLSHTLTGASRTRALSADDSVVRRLNELKNTVSQLREIELSTIPSWSDILLDVSPRPAPGCGHPADSPYLVWKVASAFLHGSSGTMRSLSDLEQLTDFAENGIASMEMRPSWRMLAASFGVCVQMLCDLQDRFEYLATHDYSHRTLQTVPAA